MLFSAPHFYNTSIEPKVVINEVLPTTGTISIIFLRVEFSDIKFGRSDFTSMLNAMKDYYRNASSFKLNLDLTITQTFVLDKTMGYYGNPERKAELKKDVIAKATLNGINLSKYHSIMILHAGAGEETGNDPNQIGGDMSNLTNMALLQADNNGIFDEGDPFPGPTRNCLLDDNTKPSLIYFNNAPSHFKIEILTFHIKGKAFPNPINLNKTHRVFFEVERSATCDIYNIKGECIKSLLDHQNTGRIYWDIDNIASGVYIFVIKDKLGKSSFGKIGIIK